jgi:tetratricopeptide (TPR) repeat protein
LLKQWNSKQTGFIYTGQANKQFNLEYSIQLSIDSGRMRASPSAKELLGVLSMLPDGIHMKQMERFIIVLSKIDILSGICTLQECGIISVIGERYQTHSIIRTFCKTHILVSQKHKNALIDFYLNLASTSYSRAKANEYTEMVLEVNNTKAMLSSLLKSGFKNYNKLVEAIYNFTQFYHSIGDFSDQLISQTVEHLQHINASKSLVIKCLEVWGMSQYYANNLENAKVKLQEAEMLCRTSKENKSIQHANIYKGLGHIYILQIAFNEARISYENALEFYKLANSILGQANAYCGLGESYLNLDDLNKAEASYQKALELSKLINNTLGQGNSHYGLGRTYLELNKLNEAEASFQKALELYKLSNAILSQENALRCLGIVQMNKLEWQDAKTLFENALIMHKEAQSAHAQANNQYYLNKVLSKISHHHSY